MTEQIEYLRKGLAMIRKARDQLESDMKSKVESQNFVGINELLLDVLQKFVNRVDYILANGRDENDPSFKDGLHWRKRK
jgi:hypothetical protein